MTDSKCEKNRNFVLYRPSFSTGWVTSVPMEAETTGSLLEETYAVLTKTGKALDNIFCPNGLEYTVHYGKGDGDFDTLLELEEGEMNRIDIDSKQSVTRLVSELQTEIETFDSPIWLSLIQVDSGGTKIRLVDGDYRIDKNSDLFKREWGGEFVATKTSEDPLTFSVFADLRRSPNEFTVRVWTNTDIWFEDTEIGAMNRARLGDALQRVRNELDSSEFELHSDSYSAGWLRKQGFHEIVPEE